MTETDWIFVGVAYGLSAIVVAFTFWKVGRIQRGDD